MKKYLVLVILLISLCGCEQLQKMLNPTPEYGDVGMYGKQPDSMTASSMSSGKRIYAYGDEYLTIDLQEIQVTDGSYVYQTVTGKLTPASKISFEKGKYHRIHGSVKVKKGAYHGVKITITSMKYENQGSSQTFTLWDGVPIKYWMVVDGVMKEVQTSDGTMEFTTANGGLTSPIDVDSATPANIIVECYPHGIYNGADTFKSYGVIVTVRWTALMDAPVVD